MTKIRPTRRGLALGGVSLALLGLGILANTAQVFVLLVPFAVVSAVGYWQVLQQPPPQIDRHGAVSRRAGSTVTVELDVQGSSRLLGTITDGLPYEGITAKTDQPRRLAGSGTHTFQLSYQRRGRYDLGPTTVTITDSIGLFQRPVTIQTKTSVYVYPALVRLPGALTQALETAHGDTDPLGRTAFDRLREYDRSVPLRDIDWKASAKQPDELFIVKEFIGAQRRGTDDITIAVAPETTAGADQVASVAAAIVVYLLDQDIPVGLQTPEADLTTDTGTEHHREIDEHLAVLEPGTPVADDADVEVTADDEGVTVTVFDETHTMTAPVPTAQVSQP